jgi:hypothetical protein
MTTVRRRPAWAGAAADLRFSRCRRTDRDFQLAARIQELDQPAQPT